MGPILCIVKTDKINKIGQRSYATYGSEVRVSNPIYVDDIVGVGCPMVIEKTVEHLKPLEETKKFTFSNIKSVIVKIGNKDRGY